MRWSCLPVSLFPQLISGGMHISEWADAARGMGFDAVDLSILFVKGRTPTGLKSIRTQLGGMPVAMITTYPDFTQPDENLRAKELAHAVSDIAVASELGAGFIRLTAGQVHKGLPDEAGIRAVRDCFEVCCEKAERWGVVVLLENHSKPGAWERPDFDFHTQRFLALVDALKDLPVGINFDTANTYALGDDAPGLFAQVYDRVKSIHINDIRDVSKLEFVGIGDGTAPISSIFSVAKARGYDGLLSIEEVGREGLEGIRRSFSRAKALWDNA